MMKWKKLQNFGIQDELKEDWTKWDQSRMETEFKISAKDEVDLLESQNERTIFQIISLIFDMRRCFWMKR